MNVILEVVFTTILHISEAKRTAETMVVGTDFLINPMPVAIIPIHAAIMAMTTVIFIACSIIAAVKPPLTRCIVFSVIPNIKKIMRLLIIIEIIVNMLTTLNFENKIFFLLIGYEKSKTGLFPE